MSDHDDAADRRALEARLRESDRIWRSLVESSPDVIMILDVDGTVLFVNRVGPPWEDHAVVGEKIWAFVPEGGAEQLVAAVRDIGQTRAPARYVAPGLRPDGTLGSYEVRMLPLTLDGELERILFSAADITDRLQKEERLAFQAHVLSQMSQPVIATDPATATITFWNEAAERVYGWKESEVLGRHSEELFQTVWLGPGGRDAMVASFRATSAWDGELEQSTRSGERLTVEVSIHLVRDERGVPLTGIAVTQDVTARKRLEEQLRQSQKMEAIGLLAGGVAHDFNNILGIIVGFAEIASRNVAAGTSPAEALAEVADAARRGAELTRKLLTLSRKHIVQPRAVDVVATVADFTRLIERIVGEDVVLVVELGATPLVVRADSVQLEQVLLNLCTNARQAMPDGGTLRVTTRSIAFDAADVQRDPWARVGTFVELSVGDTGVGMDATTRARAFEPFFTTKPEGTGLGLATAYGIVRQHGGFIHVDSAPGDGARIRVFLPLIDDVVPTGPTAPVDDDQAKGTETILVAEDEPSIRAIVATSLTDAGYTVVVASDGEEAARAFEARPHAFSLVVLEVVMPRLGARGAYERMRAITPGVKVLLTTGYAPDATRIAELLDPLRVRVLEKPFTQRALRTAVRSLLDGTPASD